MIYSVFISNCGVKAESLNETPDSEDDDDSTKIEPTNPAPTVIPTEYIKSIDDLCFHFGVPSAYSSLIPISYLQIFSDSLSIGASVNQIMSSVPYDISIILNFDAERSEENNITRYTVKDVNKDECFVHTPDAEVLKQIKIFFPTADKYTYISVSEIESKPLIGNFINIDEILANATVLVKTFMEQFDVCFFKVEFLNPQTQRYVRYSVIGGTINGTLVPLSEGSEIDCKYVTPDRRARPLYDDCIDYGSVFDININLVNNTIYSKLTSTMAMSGGMGNAELRVFAKLQYERINKFNYTVLNLTTILRNDTYFTIHDTTTLGIMQMILDKTISPGEHIPFNDLTFLFENMMGLYTDYQIIESIGLGYMDDYHFYALKNGSNYLEVYDHKFMATELSPCVPNTEEMEDGVWRFSFNFLMILAILIFFI